jgi:hypothetical protein
MKYGEIHSKRNLIREANQISRWRETWSKEKKRKLISNRKQSRQRNINSRLLLQRQSNSQEEVGLRIPINRRR